LPGSRKRFRHWGGHSDWSASAEATASMRIDKPLLARQRPHVQLPRVAAVIWQPWRACHVVFASATCALRWLDACFLPGLGMGTPPGSRPNELPWSRSIGFTPEPVITSSLEPGVRLLHRPCRPLLRGLEQAHRTALDDHVHRTPRLNGF
jgi:hypothetical protein